MGHKYIDWYCDGCKCYMNDQPGFRTDTGRWVCINCGYENDVTENNVRKKRVHFLVAKDWGGRKA